MPQVTKTNHLNKEQFNCILSLLALMSQNIDLTFPFLISYSRQTLRQERLDPSRHFTAVLVTPNDQGLLSLR